MLPLGTTLSRSAGWKLAAKETPFDPLDMQGPGNQDLNDESWAIDNLSVQLDAVPEPGSGTLVLAGLAGLARAARPRAA